MLVLARRPGQRILFPALNVSVQVVATKGATVRLGIDAPPSISVVREELASQPATLTASDRQARHDLCGRLNTLAVALHVIEKQLKAGQTADAQRTLHQAQEVLENLSPAAFLPAEPTPPSKPLEALLVEDNPNEEALLSSYLRLSGFRVETVHDGCEALAFLAEHPRPDFLLLDMRLPRCDGPTTVAAIRQNPAYQGLTIFAVTGSAPTDYNLPVGSGGVDAWFQKPLNPKRIVEAMSTAAVRN